ncbi:dUTP diphosphatase [Kocuria palustris]|uniref:dUTP diphosphatase n=1 Tax=Kocuria palustris TaxID=71999 RepID=UPI0037C03705
MLIDPSAAEPAETDDIRDARGAQQAPLRLQVRRLDPDLPLPAYAKPGDAGMDLRASHGAVIEPGRRALIGTGLAVAVPPGWVGLVHPRSGLAARHGVTVLNAPGTVDSGYRGEIKVALLNTDPDEPFRIGRGDRIAQLLLQRVAAVELDEVDELAASDRGGTGFGSSGTR